MTRIHEAPSQLSYYQTPSIVSQNKTPHSFLPSAQTLAKVTQNISLKSPEALLKFGLMCGLTIYSVKQVLETGTKDEKIALISALSQNALEALLA